MTYKSSNEAELVACIVQTKNLLLRRRFGLLLRPNNADRARARALVHSTLPGLAPQEKGALVRALYESALIGEPGKGAVLDLGGADLSGAELRGAELRYADLASTNLTTSDLREVDLRWANLARADLAQADLRQANLRLANLVEARLEGADLADADLGAADLSGAVLDGADLQGAKLGGVDSKRDASAFLAELVEEPAGGSPLGSKETSEHFRRLARLRRGPVSGTTLVGASLRGANLAGAKVTRAQLGQAASVEGAVLPEEI